jgi:hypothetical protein
MLRSRRRRHLEARSAVILALFCRLVIPAKAGIYGRNGSGLARLS